VGSVEFAMARLDEDFWAAERAMRSKAEWRAFAGTATRPPTTPPGRRRLGREVYEFLPGGREAYGYIIRYDPQRALREVAAGRDILDRHMDCGTGDGYCDDGGHGFVGWGCCQGTLGTAQWRP
jgi:hypothetical protein